jgi:hypothetical protein
MRIVFNYKPVKDYAEANDITLDAAYKRILAETVEVKKIGTYTLIRDITKEKE